MKRVPGVKQNTLHSQIATTIIVLWRLKQMYFCGSFCSIWYNLSWNIIFCRFGQKDLLLFLFFKVFLDLPSPWDAIKTSKDALKVLLVFIWNVLILVHYPSWVFFCFIFFSIFLNFHFLTGWWWSPLFIFSLYRTSAAYLRDTGTRRI